MDPYTLKKILAPLLSPLPQALIWLAVGVLLLWFSRRQHLGKLLVTGSMTLLVITCLRHLRNGPFCRPSAMPSPKKNQTQFITS